MIHAKFGASSASRWLGCPGSYKMNENLPSHTSSYAEEGTLAHSILDHALKKKLKKCPANFEKKAVVEEMQDAINVALDFIWEEAKNGTLKTEQQFALSHLHPDMFGTTDIVISAPFGTLRVFDFKYGAGIPVEVENNSQLLFYAIGAAWDKESKRYDDYEKVILGVIQPRAYHIDGPIRLWETTVDRLEEFGNELVDGVKKALEPGAPLFTGEHCRFCNAKAFCPKVHQETALTTQSDFDAVEMANPDHLTFEQIAKVIEKEKQIVAFIEACSERAKAALLDGKEIPGLKLVNKRSRKFWNLESEELQSELLKIPGLNPEDIVKSEVKTVPQIEKLLGKKDQELLSPLFTKVDGDLDIAPISDRRKPAKVSAQKDFEQIEEEF